MEASEARAVLDRVRSRVKAADHLDAGSRAVADQAGRLLAGNAAAGQAAQTAAFRAAVRGEAVRAGLAALGVGAGARGLLGLYQLANRRGSAVDTKSGPVETDLPYPVEGRDDPRAVLGKRGLDLGGYLGGGSATKVENVPFRLPALVAAAGGGAALGWKGVDALLDAHRRRQRDQELEEAKAEFDRALLVQYDRPLPRRPGLKAAADRGAAIGADLDAAFDAFAAAYAKRAAAGQTLLDRAADASGPAAGLYLTYAGLAGLLSGGVTYDQLRRRSRQAVLTKALKDRQRRDFLAQPPEIRATPVPVAGVKPLSTQEESDLLSPEG